MPLEEIFATVVSVLAALAVIGLLVFVVVWEVCAIRRTLAAHKRPPSPQESTERFWLDRGAATVPSHRKW
jgi:hypothetical protein